MLFLRKIAIFALRITGRRVGDGPGEMPEWSIGPHSKCGVRATVPGVRIPLSPQTTGWSAGLQTFVCNLFYFRGGQICLAGENQEFARSPPVRRREGRAACGNAKSSALCRRVEPGRNVVRKHSFFVSATRQSRSNGLMADTFFVSGHLYPPAGSGRGVFCEADPQSLIFQTIKFEKPQTLLAAFQLPG